MPFRQKEQAMIAEIDALSQKASGIRMALKDSHVKAAEKLLEVHYEISEES